MITLGRNVIIEVERSRHTRASAAGDVPGTSCRFNSVQFCHTILLEFRIFTTKYILKAVQIQTAVFIGKLAYSINIPIRVSPLMFQATKHRVYPHQTKCARFCRKSA